MCVFLGGRGRKDRIFSENGKEIIKEAQCGEKMPGKAQQLGPTQGAFAHRVPTPQLLCCDQCVQLQRCLRASQSCP